MRLMLSFGRAVMMGLMLHAKGKRLIRQGNYKDALEVLSMGEVSPYFDKSNILLQISFSN